MTAIRVGIVDYLNAWPLAWGFLTGRQEEGFEVTYLPPAQVASRLAAGTLDVGLVPSIEAARIPGLSVVPGLCVAATHEVRSVLLLSKGPLEQVSTVALDRNSRTSACLVEILMRDRYSREPEVMEASPDAEEMLERADAALIIGDPALSVPRDPYRIWDLAAEWRALTGLPFVFAVWAVREEALDGVASLTAALEASLEAGLASTTAIVELAREELGLGRQVLRDYLTQSLSYRLDEDALAGLEEFFRRARVHSLLEGSAGLRLLEPR